MNALGIAASWFAALPLSVHPGAWKPKIDNILVGVVRRSVVCHSGGAIAITNPATDNN